MTIGRKQENLKKTMEKKRTTQKNEDKHKYGPRTLPKPRQWMHQGLDGSRYHLMDLVTRK